MTSTMDPTEIEDRKQRARTWFESLRDDICTAFEKLEDDAPADLYPDGPARFVRTPWEPDRSHRPARRWRRHVGDARTAVRKGRRALLDGVWRVRAGIPGADSGAAEDPRFWASGVSVIAHLRNPHVPAVHMNTRFVVTTKAWFGGGADLTPVLDRRRTQDDPDSTAFHGAFKTACDAHAGVAPYEKFKTWCDEYFYLPTAKKPAASAAFSADWLETDWDASFAFTQDVGRSFAAIYPQIARRNFATSWTEQDRHEQLVRRGRYVEFNLCTTAARSSG